MDKEMRLKNLAIKVAEIRSQGKVKKWSDQIKKEAIFLAKEFGITKVSKVSKLYAPSFYAWERDYKGNLKLDIATLQEKIIVTRISQNQIASSLPEEKTLIGCLVKEKTEFKIYCKDLAGKIAERFLQ